MVIENCFQQIIHIFTGILNPKNRIEIVLGVD